MNDPLGGVLVDRASNDEEREALRAKAATLPAIPADRNLVLEIEKIADGSFSPLEGFMGSRDVTAVLDTMHMADGTPWTIPVICHAQSSDAAGISRGDEVALIDQDSGRASAILAVDEIFDLDKERFAKSVFGTDDREHPGVGLLMTWGDRALAGTITMIERSPAAIPERYAMSPRRVRELIAERGWRRIVGFQTRNLGHRAHEAIQKTALEHADGLLIHPLLGWKKKGDMLPEVILEGYEILVERYFVPENVLLAGLTTAMRYAGPKEAVFHAIIRKNFGCTHFIVGRDHAGVGGYYDKYAAHRIFDEFGDELGIQPMRLHGPCWCPICEAIVTEHTCPHHDAWQQISGTEVRAMLSRGERPPEHFMRPEIGDFLIQRQREGRIFF